MKKLDLTGKKFGRLLVKRQGPHKGKYVTWDCLCDCGNEKNAVGAKLTFGVIKSCGCLEKESRGKSQKTHGEGYNETKEYRAWCKAKGRCYNKKDPKYPLYGGRGITMCEEWRNNYAAFLSSMGRAPKGTSIDRYPNNDGNYEPGNCRWATPKEQSRNQSRNILVTVPGGSVVTLAEFFEIHNLPYANAYAAIWKKRKGAK